jgi:signal transduction histidine kinase/CheY-like chemotaxis protein
VLLAELGILSIMGESFLANASATATIIADTELIIIIIKKDVFYTLAHIYPQLVLNLFAINFNRLKESNNAALHEARTREERLEKLVNERTKSLSEANAELSATRDSLIQTQKFRDQFMANMSHEIRTPMAAVLGMTNILMLKENLPDQLKYLDGIKKSSENLVVIINDILDLSKIEAGKMELEQTNFKLTEVVNLVKQIMQHKAEEKGLMLNVNYDESIPEIVIGDPTRLNQILINLAGNAIKFTEKGSVTISIKTLNKNDKTCELEFSVRDSGIGMNEEQLGKIFQSFTQASIDTSRKYGGTGLGLTISKQLVELHGGAIKVTSEPGKGSCFSFKISFPLGVEENSIYDEEIITDDMINALQETRVLVADDNMMNRMVAKDTLEMKIGNIFIDEAQNGSEVLDKLKAEDYDIILMDVQMPVIDGLEATRKIRHEFSSPKKDIIILALTASVIRSDLEACTNAGMNGYIPKPFTVEDLVIRIYNVLNKN